MRNLTVKTDLIYDETENWNFNENFKVLRYSGYREHSISLYIDYGNLSDEYDFEQDCIIEDTRENKVKLQRYLTKDGYRRVSEVFGTVEELCDDIEGVDYSNIDELYEILDDLGIEYKSNYVRMSTYGYSQGDYAEILVNAAEFEKIAGAPFKSDKYQKWFDHYFWDSPIFGEVQIKFDYTNNYGVNFTYDDIFVFQEWAEDEYEADTLRIDDIIKTIKKEVMYPLKDSDYAAIKDELSKIDYQNVNYPCRECC